MIRVYQTKRGIGGNCLAACLASIFHMDLADFPDLAPPECFTDWTVQPRLRNQWLSEKGFDYLEIDLGGQAFTWTQAAIPKGPCLFAVESATPELREKGYGHFVVGQLSVDEEGVGYMVIHDPLGELRGDYKITAVGFFVYSGRAPEGE